MGERRDPFPSTVHSLTSDSLVLPVHLLVVGGE